MSVRLTALARVAIGLVLVVALVGCSATRGRRGAPEPSGFLRDYSQLHKDPNYRAALIYIDPHAEWARYDAIEIDSVSLWGDAQDSGLTEEDQQMLTQLAFKSLQRQLSRSFAIAEDSGPGVLRLRAAITKATGAKVPARVVTSFLPPALVFSTAAGLSADVARNVGQASIEAEVLDSVTLRRLAAAVDSRAGTKHPFTTRTFSKWGDVEAALDEWAVRIRDFLVRQGVQQKPSSE